jgi:hypothetical protein
MTTRPANELLYDSEAALRLVDTALDELRAEAEGAGAPAAEDGIAGVQRMALVRARQELRGLTTLPHLLVRASHEIGLALDNLRECRGVLERATHEKLPHTKAKLAEVSSATETAATDIMDAIDRSLALVDELDGCGDGNGERAAAIRGTLRDELFGVMGHLQFQDITTQQLNHVAAVLADIERRLAHVTSAFDPAQLPPLSAEDAVGAAHFDPAATTAAAHERQALVDEIFGRRE